jgi:hypothetical protein
VIQRAELQRAAPLLARALPHCVEDVRDVGELIAAPGAVFELRGEGGETIAALSLQVEGPPRVLRCLAAGAKPGANALPAFIAFMEHQARRIGAEQIACTTRRPGLLRALQRRGWQIAGRQGSGFDIRKGM